MIIFTGINDYQIDKFTMWLKMCGSLLLFQLVSCFVVTLMPSICYVLKFESCVIFRQDAQKIRNSINIILLLFSFDH